MDPDAPLAPPVVAVVVVHVPGAWFDDTLEGLADQDYPNLNTLFLLTGGSADADGADLAERIRRHLPDAFVRDVAGNPGFGPAANEVLRFVEGDSGFFCFCHDDVAMEPDAVRLLVEELYRSNAGVVGPKLVDWDEPAVLQHVGLGLDRFGEIDPITEPGEYDQEQHDAVRDVFAVPSACLLVRADLFRTLGGFDPAIPFHGDDIDLCWRVHLSGARVIVAPQARVRHVEQLDVRRPDLNHEVLRARHRMRSVATLTGGSRLPVRALEVAALTVVELVIGLFTGRLGQAWASARGVVGLIPRLPSIATRRRAIAKLRQVPDAEVLDLQVRGSARLTSYRRAHDTETYVGEETAVRRWRDRSLAVPIAWVVVLVGVFAASRTMIDTKVPAVGELLPLPESAAELWRSFTAGWNPNGFGATSANPTGWAVISLASPLWLFRMGLGLTVVVVGLVLLGILGTWRLATLFPTNRARIAAFAVYAAVPLVPGVLSSGRLTALVTYATVPWFVHLLRNAVGVGTADPTIVDDSMVDGILELARRERIRRTAVLAITVALGVAMAPAVLAVVVAATFVIGLSTLLVGAGWRTAASFTGLGLAGSAGAWILNLPWSATWSWDDIAAPTLAGSAGRRLVDVAAMDIGGGRLAILALFLYVPVVVALAVARGWRLTWAARAAGLVIAFGALAVLAERDVLPMRLPDVGVMLVPLALGLALSAAAAVAAFTDDVAVRGFGWRQPVGLVAMLTIAVGVFPAVLSVTDGSWFAPRNTLAELVGAQLPEGVTATDAAGDPVGAHRVLFIGDPRLLPLPSVDRGAGVALAVADGGQLDLRDRWRAPANNLDDDLADVLDDIASTSTLRGGRMLAPFGIRYVVVPLIDGAQSTAADPLPVPAGLLEALGAQLDLVLQYSPSNFAIFENGAAIPTTAHLGPQLDAARDVETLAGLVGLDTSTAEAALDTALGDLEASGPVAAGTLHLGVPRDDAWHVTVEGAPIEGQSSFAGVATAFEVPGGPVTLDYTAPGSRRVLLLVQAGLWLGALIVASRIGVPARLRARRVQDETLIDLDELDDVALVEATEAAP